MYAKLNNGQIEKYPYTIGQLRKDNHNVSFPKNISTEVLASFNVVEVQPVDPPIVSHTQIWQESTPILENGVWKQAYVVSDIDEQDLILRTESQKESVRTKRDKLLAETDWTQVADAPVDQEAWATYRQALRDIPAQAGFPWTITWPDQPE